MCSICVHVRVSTRARVFTHLRASKGNRVNKREAHACMIMKRYVDDLDVLVKANSILISVEATDVAHEANRFEVIFCRLPLFLRHRDFHQRFWALMQGKGDESKKQD